MTNGAPIVLASTAALAGIATFLWQYFRRQEGRCAVSEGERQWQSAQLQAQRARAAARTLQQLTSEQRVAVLHAMADALEANAAGLQ